jgi:hypothetical protein
MPGGRGSSLGCGPGGRLWSAISRTLMTLLGRRTRVVVPIAIVRLVSFFGRPGDLHRLADRPRGPTISLRSSANRAWLEGLRVWMQSGAVCTPQFPVPPSEASCPPPNAAHRPLESPRRAALRPRSSPPLPPHRPRAVGCSQLFSETRPSTSPSMKSLSPSTHGPLGLADPSHDRHRARLRYV